MRALTIGASVWSYRIGRERIDIVAPCGRKSSVKHEDLTGRAPGTIAWGRRTRDRMVTPREVRLYIEANTRRLTENAT